MFTKICTKCGKEKPATEEYFKKQKRGKYGLRGECKECVAIYAKQWRIDNKEHREKYRIENKERDTKNEKQWYVDHKEYKDEYTKQWYAKNKERKDACVKRWESENRERRRETKRVWEANNKDKVLQYQITSREKNRAILNARRRKYVKDNPEKVNVLCQKRRAKKLQILSDYNLAQWDNAKLFFNNQCAYCGQEKSLSQDHFIPLSKGGEYTLNNIIPACKSCNGSKHDKDFFEWYPKYKHYSKEREQKILKYLNYKNKVQQLSIF